jgi:hypothetical protein
MLAFPASMRVHNVFHMLLLKKYVPNPNHIIYWTLIQVEYEGDFRVEPICILDQKVKVLKNKDIGMEKVQWNCYGIEYATWEHEEKFKKNTPNFFPILKEIECKTPF